MTEITLHIQTDQSNIDPAFFDNLYLLAKQYGLHVEDGMAPDDSTRIVREGRDWLDRRDAERAAASIGVQQDLSFLDRMRG